MPQQEAEPGRTSSLVNGFQHELDLLQRHVRMIQFVQEHGPIGIIRLSSLLGVPKHKVRYSLRILEKEGYIRASPQGAVVTDNVREFFQHLKGLLGDVTTQIEDLRGTLGNNGHK